MELIILRHGETAWTLSGQHTGTTEISLTPGGREEAAAVRPFLGRLLHGKRAVVYCSPRERAVETAGLALPDEELRIEPLVAEFDYGEYEGLTGAEIQERAPGWSIWRDGCPGGESPGDVGARAERFLAGRIRGVADTAVVVTHGHFSRILAVTAVGRPAPDGEMFASSTASIAVIRERDGRRAIALWNWTAGGPAT